MTDGDAKEWVTVKVPEGIRDDARDDARTYGEIMRAGIDAPNPEADADVNRDLLAEQVVDLLAPKLDGDGGAGGDLETEIAKLREQVERMPAETADELEGRFR